MRPSKACKVKEGLLLLGICRVDDSKLKIPKNMIVFRLASPRKSKRQKLQTTFLVIQFRPLF